MRHPEFSFALGPEEPRLTPESTLWSTPLPSSRHHILGAKGDAAGQGAMTYGDYFTAARDFLSRDRFGLICHAVSLTSGRAVTAADLEHISVHLVKFGAFYHPAYVAVTALGHQLAFVLNAAVSPVGFKLMPEECRVLSALRTHFSVEYWPLCFGMGRGRVVDGVDIPMFLGQWFEGFYEFHLTGEHPRERQVVVWDTDGGHCTLDTDQVADAMAQAAAILTHAYNPLTFDAIGRWHNAAGDFVISLDGGRVDLRMITVRQYAPIIENLDPDVGAVLDALLLYFVEISLKLRLDRLDGVGQVVCHGDHVVQAIYRGFFKGLHKAAPVHGLPDDFGAAVKEYLALHGVDQLTPMVSAVVGKFGFDTEDQALLKRISDSHVSTLATVFTT